MGNSALAGWTAGPGAPTTFTGGTDFLGSWDVVATYIDPIETPSTLGGAGDTFAALEIDFVGNSPVGVFDAGDFMDFRADTDKVIPEPASVALLALAAPLLLRRRK